MTKSNYTRLKLWRWVVAEGNTSCPYRPIQAQAASGRCANTANTATRGSPGRNY